MKRAIAFLAACAFCAQAQSPPNIVELLNQAYDALRAKDYDKAVHLFQGAVQQAPDKSEIRKDLAYGYLKIGETAAARDEFLATMKLNPQDSQSALEYAFLANDTGKVREARLTFDRLRKSGNATAETAFQNIDHALGAKIDQWQNALKLSPDNFSAHEELARAAENRNDLALAAEHFQRAWELKPAESRLLVDLGRVFIAANRIDEGNAALLAASRRGSSRVEETARELLPKRYPYVYEFQKALVLDPGNVDLRRELAYLHLEMRKRDDAEREFRRVLQVAPNDTLSTAQLGFLLLDRNEVAQAMPLLERVMKSGDKEITERVREVLRVPVQARKKAAELDTKRASAAPAVAVAVTASPAGNDAKELGEKSLRAGYLKDALKYLTIAHEMNPNDYAVVLKLGWVNNMLHEDKQAMEWFALARRSDDAAISQEASKAYSNLRPEQAMFRTSLWTFPFYSSRWKDLFDYSQLKTEAHLGSLPIRPYVSMRFIGDSRNTSAATASIPSPQYLSESSVIVAFGMATQNYKGFVAWAEAGESIRYRYQPNTGFMTPDYRGGVSYAKGFGTLLGAETSGMFFETNDDAVYVSRFQHDSIGYLQNRFGYTFKPIGPVSLQLYWNANITADVKRQYWANTFELGPGAKFRVEGMPQGLSFSVNALRGVYLVNEGNPRGPQYNDFRAGFWYAFTH